MVRTIRFLHTTDGDTLALCIGERVFGFLVWKGEFVGAVYCESDDDFEHSMSVRYLDAEDKDSAAPVGVRIKDYTDIDTNCCMSVITASAKLFRDIGGLSFGGKLSIAIVKPVSWSDSQ